MECPGLYEGLCHYVFIFLIGFVLVVNMFYDPPYLKFRCLQEYDGFEMAKRFIWPFRNGHWYQNGK